MEEVVQVPERKIGGFQLELVSFLRQNEDFIDFKRLELRARELGAITGEEEAKFILSHQNLVPESWRRFKLLFCGWSRFCSESTENWKEFAILTWKDGWYLEWRMCWMCLGLFSKGSPFVEDGGGQLGDRLVRCIR